MKRLITGAMALLLLVSLTVAGAGYAGTSADPLISQSYLEGQVVPNLNSQLEDKLDESLSGVLEDAEAKLAAILAGMDENSKWRFADTYDHYIMYPGSAVRGQLGTTFMVTKGQVSVTVSAGALVELSTGREVASGEVLALNTRYFCCEDSDVYFFADGQSVAAVNGSYLPSGTISPAESKYEDVSVYIWFFDTSEYVYQKKLYNDWNSPKFRGNDPATRAELVYALWVANGSPIPTTTPVFWDLTEDWYKTAVAWASENKIVDGFEDDSFGPQKNATREQIATVMYRYAAYMFRDTTAAADLSVYTDADLISGWALTQLQWANAEGLITGVSDTELRPRGTATRAQIATIIMRYVEGRN